MQAIDCNRAILLFSDIDLVASLSSSERLLQAIAIEQVIQFFIVYLQEAALYQEL